ncbi:hypothetical protein [Vreelandella sulfidaeris]
MASDAMLAVSLSPSLPLSQPVHEGDSANRTTRLTEEACLARHEYLSRLH